MVVMWSTDGPQGDQHVQLLHIQEVASGQLFKLYMYISTWPVPKHGKFSSGSSLSQYIQYSLLHTLTGLLHCSLYSASVLTELKDYTYRSYHFFPCNYRYILEGKICIMSTGCDTFTRLLTFNGQKHCNVGIPPSKQLVSHRGEGGALRFCHQ